MIGRAFSGSAQKFGFSVRAVRSSSRAWAVSQSKMPPQQVQHLLDFGDGLGRFGAHFLSSNALSLM
jgi:phosphoglycerate dehydrogenase-like enzyme